MPEEEKSFWKTLPGIITAIAGLLTAVTGLFVVLNQAGWLKKDQPLVQSEAVSTVKPAENAAPSHENSSPVKLVEKASYEVKFAMDTIKAGDYDYTILGASLKAVRPDVRELSIKLRMMNNSHYGAANFWDNSFRLKIDGVPASPTGNLNETVEKNAAKDESVTFDVPNEARELVFIIMDQDKPISIPVEVIKK